MRLKVAQMTIEQKGFVLAIDCGTQSLRTLIYDGEGHLLAKIQENYEPYFSTEPGYAEKDPDEYWQVCIACFHKLNQNYGEYLSNVKAITVTAMRNTGVYLDEKFQVIRPSIIWLDQREVISKEKISLKYRTMFKLVNMTEAIELTRKQCKANWLRVHEPKSWKKIRYFLQLSGFFHYKLTGQIVDSIGNQIGHIPFDYKKRNWPKSDQAYQWEVFQIEREKLPRLVESGTILGALSEQVRVELGLSEGILVIANGSDKGCETLGIGCLSPETASISFGTTATIQTTTDQYVEPLKFMPAYPAAIPKRFNPEIQIYRGYWMIKWFKQEFAHHEIMEAQKRSMPPEELLNQLLHTIPPGSEGLVLQPFWTPGLKNPEAKGAIIGFSDVHTRAHLYRAIIEGINFGLKDGLEKIEKATGVRVKTIYVSGGGSQSDEICQITADMFDLPVVKGETYEAAGLGAAINAFVALGVHKTVEDAVNQMVRSSKVFVPNFKNAEIYRQLFEKVYKSIYPRLKEVYIQIDKISKPKE